MRWENLTLDSEHSRADAALFGADAVTTRTFDTPSSAGITFHEVRARSIINRVPAASRMSFEWTVNPYRGCSHACVYCFARKTHSYLDLDTGLGFDSQIVVKINAPELLRRQLGSRRWQGEHIAMGTNVDCYQRAEGRYRLMPGIIAALRDHANPFSILTKGTLILRDLDLISRRREVTDVGISVSVGFTDPELWRTVEPGTPAPERRLEVVRTLGEHGIGCGVLMAPVIPFLSDQPAQLRATVRAIAASWRHVRHAAGAASAARRPRVVHGLAGAAPSAPGGPVRAAVRGGLLRPEVVPAPDHPSGPRAGARSTASAPRARACPGGSGRPEPGRRDRRRPNRPNSRSSRSIRAHPAAQSGQVLTRTVLPGAACRDECGEDREPSRSACPSVLGGLHENTRSRAVRRRRRAGREPYGRARRGERTALRRNLPRRETRLEEVRHHRLPDAPVRVPQGAARPRATRTGGRSPSRCPASRTPPRSTRARCWSTPAAPAAAA